MKQRSRKGGKLARLGISDVDMRRSATKSQKEMLRCLERASIDSSRVAGLQDCTTRECGRIKCAEVCEIGQYQRQTKQISAAYRLLQTSDEPLYEVRVGRASWAKPAGKLDRVSIAAAKKLVRRALDKILKTVTAVGTFRVSVAPKYAGGGWKCEFHLVVAGAEKAEIARAFASGRNSSNNLLLMQKVEDLGQALKDVLKTDLHDWDSHWQETSADRPKRKYRTEYYSWLLDLEANERLFRYGCDKYFNRLKKRPRPVKAKVHKKRRYPIWLRPFMFGSHPQTCRCSRCLGAYPLN